MKKLAIVMQTDFGPDIAVCAMKAVCHSVDPDLKIYDGTHHVRQFDVLTASDSLMYYIPYWPKDTVFISVVDRRWHEATLLRCPAEERSVCGHAR